MLDDKLKVQTGDQAASSKDEAAEARSPFTMLMPTEQQVRDIERLRSNFLTSPETEMAIALLNRLYAFGNTGSAVGSAAQNILFTGPSGGGKTRTLKFWESLVTGKFKDTDTIPILHIDIRAKMTPKAILEQMLLKLGAPPATFSRASEGTLIERVIFLLRERGVRVVVFDEVQHLLEHKTDLTQFLASEFVKSMLNASVCPFVLSGTEVASEIYKAKPQLQRRSMAHIVLNPYWWSDPERQKQYRRLLRKYSKHIPLSEPSDLADYGISMRINYFCEALIGRSYDFVVNATQTAMFRGATSLTREVLRETAELFRDPDNPHWFNPFNVADQVILNATTPEPPSPKSRVSKGKVILKESDI